MAIELAAAYVSLVPSAKGIEGSITRQLAGLPAVFGQVGDKGGAQLESGVKKRIGNVTKLIGAIGIGTLLHGAFDEATEAQKVGAQTTAVIKSTGAAAGVTANQVGNLATSISNYAGIDDEAIQAGENMLLTFTNIKNGAGENNDIFNQATKILVDMSVAMGTDAKSSAIQLGKALNDPIKGVTALTKVGVTFTDEQKSQIAAMVQTGNVAGAQKVILAELTKEFGGSAAAQATAADKAKVAFGNLEEQIGTALMPAITGLANFISGDVIPVLSATVGFVQHNASTFKVLAAVVLGTWAAWKGYTIIKVAAAAISGFGAKYSQYVAQLSSGNRAQQAASSGLQATTGSAGRLGGTLLTLTAGVGLATYAWQQHAKAQREAKQRAADVLDVLKQTNGVVGQEVTALNAQKFATEGVFDAAQKYGLSIDTVTRAAQGDQAALAQVTAATRGHYDAIQKVLVPIVEQGQALDTAKKQYGQVTTATKSTADATAALTPKVAKVADVYAAANQAAKDAKAAQREQVAEMRVAGDAAGLLKLAFDRLNGKTLDVNDATVGWASSLLAVDAALKQNGTTVALNTQAGIDNNRAISDAIHAAQAHAEAVSGGKELTQAGTQAYKNDLLALRDHIKAIGGDTTAIQALIDKIGAVPPVQGTRFEIDTAVALKDAAAYKKWLHDNLSVVVTQAQISTKVFDAGERGTSGVLGHNARGTDFWRGGPTWIGEQGPEIVDLPRGARVLDNRSSMKMAGGGTTIERFEQNITNPVPEVASVSAAQGLRRAAAALDAV